MKKVFSAEQISERVEALGAEIRKDAGDSEVVLLAILKGSAVFLADLLRAVPGKVTYEFISKIQDFTDTEIADALAIDFTSRFEIRGRKTYLLKDVVSTGVIESYLMAQLRQREPDSLRLVALIDRPDQRTVPLEADFRAFIATRGRFVGYGLEQERGYSNLPYIGAM
jgi:hypoxanthine phosphoribosyltransferase